MSAAQSGGEQVCSTLFGETELTARAARPPEPRIPDYVELEITAAGKDNIVKSTNMLAEFPTQVIVGKQTNALANLRGRHKGAKKRFSDGKQTKTFRRWMRRNRAKLAAGDPSEQVHFERVSARAAAHLEEIKRGADTFATDLEEATKQFTEEELRRIRNREPFADEMIEKFLARIFHFSAGFTRHSASHFLLGRS